MCNSINENFNEQIHEPDFRLWISHFLYIYPAIIDNFHDSLTVEHHIIQFLDIISDGQIVLESKIYESVAFHTLSHFLNICLFCEERTTVLESRNDWLSNILECLI